MYHPNYRLWGSGFRAITPIVSLLTIGFMSFSYCFFKKGEY